MDISILMITFNHEKFIAEAIESVLIQKTYFSWELIISDDCSNDNTRHIVNAYASKYPQNIKIIPRLENIGMMRNFVDSLKFCTGKYVAFLEGDDYWCDSLKLQKQFEFLEKSPTVAMCATSADVRIESANRNIPDTTIQFSTEARFSTEDLLVRNPAHTCTYMVRKSAIPELSEDFLKLHLGDFPLWILISKSGDLVKIPDITAVYRIHLSGVWSSESQIRKLQHSEEMYSFLLSEFDQKGIRRAINGQIHATISRKALYSINTVGFFKSIPLVWTTLTFRANLRFSIFHRLLPFLGLLPGNSLLLLSRLKKYLSTLAEP